MARHSSLAEQLAAVLEFAKRPESRQEPVQTNWSTVAANDNDPIVVEEYSEERRVSIRPTIGEIMRSVESGHTERNSAGQIVRIGRFRFSDGTQTERCTMYGIDGKPIEGDITMPVGAMLGTSEAQERTLGGSGVGKGESNAFFAEIFDVANRKYTPGGKKRRGKNYTAEESRALLAQAIANTKAMPDVEYCEDGMALGSANVADNFIGMKKSPKGNGGSISWQDLSEKISQREEWEAVERELSRKDLAVLDAVTSARNMSQVGQSIGFTGKHAERRGKRALLAANDNLARAIRAYVG